MSKNIKIISGISSADRSVQISNQFEIELNDEAKRVIGYTTNGAKQNPFTWNIQKPDGSIEIVASNENILRTSISNWDTAVGIYKFYVTKVLGNEENPVNTDKEIPAEIDVTGLSDVLNENIRFGVRVPSIESSLSPFLLTIPLQFLAYHVAFLKNHDIDKPRNLAKSVTVE